MQRSEAGTHQGNVKASSRADQGHVKERRGTAVDFGEIDAPRRRNFTIEPPIVLPGGCLLYRLPLKRRNYLAWGDEVTVGSG